jgi:parvulin-like peptidyl-prolyl isomerase
MAAARPKGRNAWLGMILGGLCVLAAGIAIRYAWGPDSASADPTRPATKALGSAAGAPAAGSAAGSKSAASAAPQAEPAPPSAPSQPKVAAVVNGEQITRDELGRECLRHYGREVLESMVNKYLIVEECKRRNIVVTRAEVDAEIDRMARQFRFTVDQWLKLLKEERGISPLEYADLIWTTLALRKIAGERLQVSQEELVQAYENQYGPAVRARLIACKDPRTAERVRQQAAANPDQFGNLAKQYSEDASASVKGLIQPIRKHCGYREIEQAAFSMADGEVSRVIPAAGQYVILKREALLPSPASADFKKAAPQLEEGIRERKMRAVAGEVLQQLQKAARVENVLNDPAKSRAMPGVAALINDHRITLRDLAEQCIERHGQLVLEGTINRRLIEQACKKRNIAVSQGEIDGEIQRAAEEMVPPKPDGSPDVEAWLKTVVEQQRISLEVYRHDAVWPSVALKKLVGDKIQVTDDNMKKGYEANYGPRVRCRAIMLNSARRAQEVWEMARKRATAENFGNLAEQYSIEPSSQALRGEVPPIRQHGGQPALEKEAFSLKPGELSGVIQTGDKYVILFCEGYTKPVDVAFDEVRQEIHKDVYEKKLRLAMAECFEQLQDAATIDNFLAGSSQSPPPKQPPGPQSLSKAPTLRQVDADRTARPSVASGANRPGGATR